MGNSFTDIRGSQLRERTVSNFLKQFSQNDKKLNKGNKEQKTKTGWRLYPVAHQHSTTIPCGLNQNGKRRS